MTDRFHSFTVDCTAVVAREQAKRELRRDLLHVIAPDVLKPGEG